MTDIKEIILELNNINKSFPNNSDKRNNIPVLENISITAFKGEIITIVGPSGSGKSTLLNIIAGFIKYDSGNMLFDGNPIYGPAPDRAVIFQNSALFPWLNVRDNIGYGLKMKNIIKEKRYEEEKEYLEAISLTGFEEFYPEQLSGGMQQRVALARVLILHPKLILMDEPFSSLDYQSRLKMQQLLLDLWQRYCPTIIFVTHDIEEAVFISDKIVVFSKRPAQVIKQIPVNFNRPRDISLIKNASFTKIKNHVLDFILD